MTTDAGTLPAQLRAAAEELDWLLCQNETPSEEESRALRGAARLLRVAAPELERTNEERTALAAVREYGMAKVGLERLSDKAAQQGLTRAERAELETYRQRLYTADAEIRAAAVVIGRTE